MKIVVCFTPGLDSFIISNLFKNSNIEHQKVYFYLNSIYSNNELLFLTHVYNTGGYTVDHSLSVKNFEHSDMHVPNRNLLLATLAAGKYEADEVILGGNKDDRVSDNNQLFYDKASDVLSVTMEKKVLVYSPLIAHEKSHWVELFYDSKPGPERFDLATKTYSCFSPRPVSLNTHIFEKIDDKYVAATNLWYKGCLDCGACFRKVCALTNANIYIPFFNIKEGINLCIKYLTEQNFSLNYPERYKSIQQYLNFLKIVGTKQIEEDNGNSTNTEV